MNKLTRRSMVKAIPACGMAAIVPSAATAIGPDNSVLEAISEWRAAYRLAETTNAAWRKSEKSRKIFPGFSTPEGDVAYDAAVAESKARNKLLWAILGEQPAFVISA
ncbi:hypothetical protein [Mesorhizobium sp. Pch-S]|uniref:hypothetical protein n=1 Tax=Mesorhizobium sp. Pch-S TaxID=2082387 RepID=UPI001012896D|nr:hypothetical protein [Mesorhizobium sp. Pch-S]QAZ45969.1 hypothetical protein C1M53_26665 [Mesorhizobium sp. Pch-S]